MKARDVMTRDVVSVGPSDTVETAACLMLDRKISGLPVIDAQSALVGIVTESDFLRRAEIGTQVRRRRWLSFLVSSGTLASEFVQENGRRISEVMTSQVYTVSEETSLGDVATEMESRHIKRVPVVAHGKLVGVIARHDLVRALVKRLKSPAIESSDDQTIRTKIVDELKKYSWSPGPLLQVTVESGVVQLCGVILDERERSAIIVAAENVPGVKTIHDHLEWIEPNSGMYLQSPEDELAEKKRL